MTSENEINIKGLYSLYPNILGILLCDNTTKKNIIWATDHYQNKGLGYSITDEIKPCHLNGKVRAVRPRIEKSKAEQTKRSKDNAEVSHHLGLLINKITWLITPGSEEKIGLIQKILIILGVQPKRLCSTAIKRGLIMLAISDWRCAVAKHRTWFQDTTRSPARQLRTKTESVSLTGNSGL